MRRRVANQKQGPPSSGLWMGPLRARMPAIRTEGDAQEDQAEEIKSSIIFEGGSQDDGATNPQAQDPRLQGRGLHALPPVEVWDAREPDAERIVHVQAGRDLRTHVSVHELRTAAEVFVPIHDHTPEGGRGNWLNFIELERVEFIEFLGVVFMVLLQGLAEPPLHTC